MSRDELRQPLKKRKLTQRLLARRPSLLLTTSALLAAGFVAATVWAVRTPYPYAGEPVVTAAIPAPEEIKTSSIAPPKEEEVVAEENVSDSTPPAVTVEAPVAQDVYQTEASIEVAPRRPLRAAPVPELVDTSLGGQLPRISASNKKPSDVYARLTPMGVIHSDRPKIAILLGGMGLNPKLTKAAIDDLPGDVTFAFAPYGENLQAQVNKARANGHEVLLQLPMEPMGYPANNPGPKTLLADADVAANMDALHWHMNRFTGYTGITNYMGGRLLSTAAALKPVMQEIQKRGLVYLEDSTTSLTSSSDVAKDVGLPERHAQIVIDSDPTPQSIAAALGLLEDQAKTNGYAIGTGSGLAVTLEAVKAWSEQLKDKGILLVPVSAMYKGKLG
jgi:polysaccharide deacetylase 2 family uncharacterized protein YibQ